MARNGFSTLFAPLATIMPYQTPRYRLPADAADMSTDATGLPADSSDSADATNATDATDATDTTNSTDTTNTTDATDLSSAAADLSTAAFLQT